MEELVTLGKIRFIGVSNFDLAEVRETQEALGRDGWPATRCSTISRSGVSSEN